MRWIFLLLLPSLLHAQVYVKGKANVTGSGMAGTIGAAGGGGGGTCTLLVAYDSTSGNDETFGHDLRLAFVSDGKAVCKFRAKGTATGTCTAKIQIWTTLDGSGSQVGTDSGTITLSTSDAFNDFTWTVNPTGLGNGTTYYAKFILVSGSSFTWDHNFVGGTGHLIRDGAADTNYDPTSEIWTMQ